MRVGGGLGEDARRGVLVLLSLLRLRPQHELAGGHGHGVRGGLLGPAALLELVNVTVNNEVLLSVVTAAISNTHLSLSTEW